jgi:hypothetical protein
MAFGYRRNLSLSFIRSGRLASSWVFSRYIGRSGRSCGCLGVWMFVIIGVVGPALLLGKGRIWLWSDDAALVWHGMDV